MRALGLLVALALPAVAAAAIRAPVPVSVAVRHVPFPTNVTFDPAGGMWITSGAGGPLDSDGVWYVRRGSHRAIHVVRGLHTALGLHWAAGSLYVGYYLRWNTGRIVQLSGFNGRRFARTRVAVAHLKIGRHGVDTIVPGPDGRIYVGVGSLYDNHGTPGRIVSFRPGGAGLRLEATGLRNPYGLAFVPGTSRLLVTDNGRDDLGVSRPPDELDAFDVTAQPIPDFGFPGCYDQGGAACAGKVAPIAAFPAHASSDGIAVTRHWGRSGLTAFVAENGSSFNDTGSDVRIVHLGRGGRTATQTQFATGFVTHDPLGAAMGPDGALYVTLFRSGEVARFAKPRR